MRKTILIIILIALFAVVVLLSYFIFLKPSQTASPVAIPKTPELKIPAGLPEEKIMLASNEAVIGYWINKTSGDIYLVKPNGNIAKLTNDKAEALTSQNISGIHKVKPSFNGVRALVQFGYPDQPAFTVFNTKDNSWSPLPSGTTAAAWSPEDNSIVFLQNDRLQIFNSETKKAATVINLAAVDQILDWPEINTILIADKPSAGVEGKARKFNLKSQSFTEVAAGKGLMLKQGGEWIIEFTESQPNKSGWFLLLRADSGTPIADIDSIILGVRSVSLPNKCAINGNEVYCAMPQAVPLNTVLPDDYLQKKFYSQDNIYEMQVDAINETIKTRLIHTGTNTPLDAVNLTTYNDTIFFINRFDQKLYKLEIPPQISDS